MSAAVFKAEIDFSAGASFDPALVLDDPATTTQNPLDICIRQWVHLNGFYNGLLIYGVHEHHSC
jgi:hypothetical protein